MKETQTQPPQQNKERTEAMNVKLIHADELLLSAQDEIMTVDMGKDTPPLVRALQKDIFNQIQQARRSLDQYSKVLDALTSNTTYLLYDPETNTAKRANAEQVYKIVRDIKEII